MAMTKRQADLESQLFYARSEYSGWAQRDDRLTRDEFAAKAAAERNVRMLETMLATEKARQAAGPLQARTTLGKVLVKR